MLDSDSPETVSLVTKFNVARELWHHAGSYDRDPALMLVNVGRKYIRLVFREFLSGDESLSCAGFVDRVTGDILYAKDRRGPTRRVRGNVFNPDGGQSAVAWHGVAMAGERS
jgi:hypothetical protein